MKQEIVKSKSVIVEIIKLALMQIWCLNISTWAMKILRTIIKCGTEDMGGFIAYCPNCHYCSSGGRHCNNRNCPNCGRVQRGEWAEKLEQRLLPINHFHSVFTIPHELNFMFLAEPVAMYKILMESTSETLLTLAKNNLKGIPSFVTILHTWGQEMQSHYHVHALIAGGVLSLDNEKWISCKKNFFLPIRIMSQVFKGIFLKKLKKSFVSKKFVIPKLPQNWNVYCAPPFLNESTCIKYFALYANRIAIADSRIMVLDKEKGLVTIKYKRNPSEPGDPKSNDPNNKTGTKKKSFQLTITEFVKRFAIHILPKGFCKIRYGGLYANKVKKEKILQAIKLIKQFSAIPISKKLSKNIGKLCPNCKNKLVFEVIIKGHNKDPCTWAA